MTLAKGANVDELKIYSTTNIPHPHEAGKRIVGFVIDEDAFKYLHEPIDWLNSLRALPTREAALPDEPMMPIPYDFTNQPGRWVKYADLQAWQKYARALRALAAPEQNAVPQDDTVLNQPINGKAPAGTAPSAQGQPASQRVVSLDEQEQRPLKKAQAAPQSEGEEK